MLTITFNAEKISIEKTEAGTEDLSVVLRNLKYEYGRTAHRCNYGIVIQRFHFEHINGEMIKTDNLAVLKKSIDLKTVRFLDRTLVHEEETLNPCDFIDTYSMKITQGWRRILFFDRIDWANKQVSKIEEKISERTKSSVYSKVYFNPFLKRVVAICYSHTIESNSRIEDTTVHNLTPPFFPTFEEKPNYDVSYIKVNELSKEANKELAIMYSWNGGHSYTFKMNTDSKNFWVFRFVDGAFHESNNSITKINFPEDIKRETYDFY